MCEQDDDCIVVPYTSCCGSTKIAINKIYLEEYNLQPSWKQFSDSETCEIKGRCLEDSEIDSVDTAICYEKTCRLDFNS